MEKKSAFGDRAVEILGYKTATCKYGENAWQAPAHLYSTDTSDPLALSNFLVLKEGSAPSYNNWCDLDRALQTLTHIESALETNFDWNPSIAIGVKHGNACGAAVGEDDISVIKQMMDGDSDAIFGGVILTNFDITDSMIEILSGKMLSGLIAPSIDPGVAEKLQRKDGKTCFLTNLALCNLIESLDRVPRFRYVRGGFLVQPNYTFVLDLGDPEVKRYVRATRQEEKDMVLAWAIGSTSNSNTITICKNGQLIGNGVGQQDRRGASKLAVVRAFTAEHAPMGAVAYSDSFFPFNDGVEALTDFGIKAILTTSGSKNDQRVIDLCTERGVGLYMIPDAIGRGFFGH